MLFPTYKPLFEDLLGSEFGRHNVGVGFGV